MIQLMALLPRMTVYSQFLTCSLVSSVFLALGTGIQFK